MSDRRLLQVQPLSGLLFAVFLAVHELNTVAAAGGARAYDEFQVAARAVYQHPLGELLLVALPLVTHVGAALVRLHRSGWRRGAQPLARRLHRYSGLFLLLVIAGHVLATRGSSLWFDVFPGFAGLSFSLWWMPWMFVPYYLLLGIGGLYHGWYGVSIALGTLGLRTEAMRRGPGLWGPVGVGAVGIVLAVLTLTGQRGEIADPTDNDYARLYEEHLGVDLER